MRLGGGVMKTTGGQLMVLRAILLDDDDQCVLVGRFSGHVRCWSVRVCVLILSSRKRRRSC